MTLVVVVVEVVYGRWGSGGNDDGDNTTSERAATINTLIIKTDYQMHME